MVEEGKGVGEFFKGKNVDGLGGFFGEVRGGKNGGGKRVFGGL